MYVLRRVSTSFFPVLFYARMNYVYIHHLSLEMEVSDIHLKRWDVKAHENVLIHRLLTLCGLFAAFTSCLLFTLEYTKNKLSMV